MKKTCFLLAFILAICFLFAQLSDPHSDILDLISLVNADTLRAYVQHLQDYQTRYALADNHLEVANWLKGQFESYGFTNTWMQEYQHNNTTQYNVIATIPGYLYPDLYIIVGGHYDSYSANSDSYVFAPGADDNASGTAGVLEIARVMMAIGYQPKFSIRFIAFSAEEVNGLGSEAYCNYAINANQEIRVMLNLDMIANNLQTSQEFRVMPYQGSEEYSYETIRIAQQYSSYQPVLGETDMGSDSGIFSKNGFNAVFFFERYLNPYLHSSDDLIDYLDFQYASEIVRAATAATVIFANQPFPVNNIQVYNPGTGNSLLAIWDSSSDPEVTKYAVYYGTEIDSMTFWQYINENQCIISGLEEGQSYYIAVCNVNDAGLTSIRKYGSGTPFSVPAAPNLIADFPDRHSITITWQPNSELDIASYSIYRSLGSNTTETMIATVPVPDTSYTDTDVKSNEEYYYYRLTANDSEGNQSPFSSPLASRMVSLDRGIYVIDESKNFSGTTPFQPTDEAVDNFYNDLLKNYEKVSLLDLEEQTGILKLADIGIYSSILWHGNDIGDNTYPYEIRDILGEYIRLGGNIFFTVYYPGKAFELNAGYPASFSEDSFINEALGIGGVNYSVQSRFKYAIPNNENYPALQVDSLKTISSWHSHIFGVEGMEPVNPEESIYLYGSDYSPESNQGSLNGKSVGIHRYYGEGQVLCLSFPLYNMQASSAQDLIDYVFTNLFQESTKPDIPIPPVTGLRLLPNYPNPFVNETTFTVKNADPEKLMNIKIYNLKGQVVQTIFNGYPLQDMQFTWNGKDTTERNTSSGIYFVKVSSGKEKVIAKIIKIK